MSVPILPPYTPGFAPAPNVTPFTYRDGLSYVQKFEALKRWINKTILPYVNEHFVELYDEFSRQVNFVIDAMNTQSAEIDEVLEAYALEIETLIATLGDSSIELQGPVLAGILDNPASASRVILDGLYAGKSIQTNFNALADARVPIAGNPVFAGIKTGARLGNRFAVLSDSNGLSPYFSQPGGTIPETNARGETWIATASIASQGKIRVALNAAVGGATSLDLLASFDTALGDKAAYWDTCALLMGSNDINAGRPIASIVNTVEEIIVKVLRLNKRVVLCAKFPSGDHSNRVSGRKLNFAYEQLAAKWQIPFIDWYTLLINPADAEWLDAADHIDAQHLSISGANKAGKFFAAELESQLVKAEQFLPRDNIDTSVMRNGSAVAFNHLWYYDADASGMPDGYSLSGTSGVTKTYAIDPAWDPKAWSLKFDGTFPSDNTRTISQTFSSASGAWAPGDIVQCGVRIKWAPTTIPTTNPIVVTGSAQTQRVEFVLECTGSTPGQAFQQILVAAHDGVIVSEPVAIPVGTTALALRVRPVGGPAVLQISRMTLRNLTVQSMVPAHLLP